MSTVEFAIHFSNGAKGRKRMRSGPRPEPQVAKARIPRVARLMALAIHFDGLIRDGIVEDYADLARLGGVSRARISQIMDLLNLAPDIQEEILSIGSKCPKRASCTERRLREVGREADWATQRSAWARMLAERTGAREIPTGGPDGLVQDYQSDDAAIEAD